MIKFKQNHIEASDEFLIKQFKDTGRIEHLTDLYSKYIELVFGVCLKYLKNEDDSKDAVMDIYEKLISKLKTHDVEYFKSWLYILTKNHCLGELRKKKRLAEHEVDFKRSLNGETIFQPFSPNLKETQLIKMEHCIQHLIENQKLCITKFYLEKQSYKDIAEQLSMSWSRVRSLIQNGRRNLKICIEKS